MKEPKKRILIIEDDQRIAQNIAKGLNEKDFETEVAYDGLIGSKIARSNHFDLIILDVNLPSMNGYEVCKNIRQRDTSIPILMLTALGETEDKIEGFEVGADDYILKPFDLRELLARISVFLRRSQPIAEPTPASVIRIADLEVNTETKMVSRGGQSLNLTVKEYALLEYMVKNTGKIISKADISENAWDAHVAAGTNVVEVYINFLRKKIDRDFEPKLIHTKSGMGYILKIEA